MIYSLLISKYYVKKHKNLAYISKMLKNVKFWPILISVDKGYL